MAAADLGGDHGLLGLLVHPLDQALGEDDQDEGERQDEDVEPGPETRSEEVLDGQLEERHGGLPGRSRHFVRGDPAVDERDLAAKVLHDLGVVGGEEEGRAELAVEPLHRLQDVVGVLGVEVGRRLVGEDEVGPLDDGPGDGHALALAAGELGRAGLGPVGEVDPFEGGHDLAAPLGRRVAEEEQGELDVLVDGVDGQEVESLEDEADVTVAQAGGLLVG